MTEEAKGENEISNPQPVVNSNRIMSKSKLADMN